MLVPEFEKELDCVGGDEKACDPKVGDTDLLLVLELWEGAATDKTVVTSDWVGGMMEIESNSAAGVGRRDGVLISSSTFVVLGGRRSLPWKG